MSFCNFNHSPSISQTLRSASPVKARVPRDLIGDAAKPLSRAPEFDKDDVRGVVTHLSYLSNASGDFDEAALAVAKGVRALGGLVYKF